MLVTTRIFCHAKTFMVTNICRNKTFVVTKERFCHDLYVFVATSWLVMTKLCLLRQIFVMIKLLSWQTQLQFSDKHIFVMTNTCLGLWAKPLYSISQHSTTWWLLSDRKFVRKEAGFIRRNWKGQKLGRVWMMIVSLPRGYALFRCMQREFYSDSSNVRNNYRMSWAEKPPIISCRKH